ncbi:MAG TPA: ECF transporter S component [Chloroflexi bacterium]|nr:ECF transporter S component [Chloroflexota bacterium]
MNKSFNATTLAVTAVMIALVAVATGFLPRLPIPGTGGYVHLGDIFVFFSAFAFGPVVGAVAGGVGCALADLLGGYVVWAPLTLVAHGVQGFVAGYLGRGKSWAGLVVAWIFGAICLVGLYFLGELLPVYGGYAGALTEVIPNLMQALIGGVVGIPLVLLVRQAYPPIEQMGTRPTWQEE